jgi:hypothetical protein
MPVVAAVSVSVVAIVAGTTPFAVVPADVDRFAVVVGIV